jgi:hypothetical protein
VLEEPDRRVALSCAASKAAARFHPPGVHAELMRLIGGGSSAPNRPETGQGHRLSAPP